LYLTIGNYLTNRKIDYTITLNSTYLENKSMLQQAKLLFGYLWNKYVYFQIMRQTV